MGIPITTPMGATGGAGLFTAIDNSLELGAISVELATIAAALTTIITVNEAKYWGTTALVVPGSPAASLANISSQLANLNDTMIDIQKGQSALTGAIGELSSAMKQQSLGASRLETLQAMAVADQIETNRFQKTETIAALQRNGIAPQPTPPIIDTLKEKISQGALLNLSTEFQTSVQGVATKLITQLKDYIVNSSIVTWGQAQLTSFWAYLGLNKLTAAVADPAKAAAELAKKASSTAARTGVWVPPVIPPNP
jgi:hypothetical protein